CRCAFSLIEVIRPEKSTSRRLAVRADRPLSPKCDSWISASRRGGELDDAGLPSPQRLTATPQPQAFWIWARAERSAARAPAAPVRRTELLRGRRSVTRSGPWSRARRRGRGVRRRGGRG